MRRNSFLTRPCFSGERSIESTTVLISTWKFCMSDASREKEYAKRPRIIWSRWPNRVIVSAKSYNDVLNVASICYYTGPFFIPTALAHMGFFGSERKQTATDSRYAISLCASSMNFDTLITLRARDSVANSSVQTITVWGCVKCRGAACRVRNMVYTF